MSVSVCVRLFYGNALQGTQIPPKTLSHPFFIVCAQEAYIIIPVPRSGKEPEEQRGER